MKILYRALILSIFFSSFSMASASAQETWLQKVKGFLFRSEKPVVEETVTVQEEEQTEPSEKNRDLPTFDFSEKVIGNKDAPLRIHVFTSLTCPHCTTVHLQVIPYLKDKYVNKGDALIIQTDFPLEPRAMTASLVAHCFTGDQYYAFMDILFEHQTQWAVAPNLQEALLPHAKLAGMSEKKMIACATDESALKEMTRQRNLNIMQYKLRVTPTVVFQLGSEKEVVQGAPSRDEIEKIIQKLKASYNGKWPSEEPKKEKLKPSAP